MTDRIGVLGEATVTSAATTTVYTCPASKAAKGKIMWRGQFATQDDGDITIAVNGISVATQTNVTGGQFGFSSTDQLVVIGAAAPAGTSVATTVSPAAPEYFLSAGDTVTYALTGSNMQAMNMQFVGTEIDV